MKKNYGQDMFLFSDLSKYRASLMGLGILGVMLAHFFSWAKLSTIIPTPFFRPFTGLVFTEGFLLLSGLGLYYSWQKKPHIKSFYSRRLNRLLIPYILLSFPFIVYSTVISNSTILESTLRLLTLKFWIFGKDSMWYISVSLVLYMAFPFIYKFLFQNPNKAAVRTLILIILWVAICYSMHIIFPNYYKSVELGLPKIWMFFLGMLLGKYAFSNATISKTHVMIYFCILMIAIASNLSNNNFIKPFGDCFLRLVTIPIICIILNVIPQKVRRIQGILNWFGKYSLELYIVHLLIYESIKFSYPFFTEFSQVSFCRIGAIFSILAATLSCSFLHEGIKRLLKI